jgi:sporulation protein YlmC with PRC-barrel domain
VVFWHLVGWCLSINWDTSPGGVWWHPVCGGAGQGESAPCTAQKGSTRMSMMNWNPTTHQDYDVLKGKDVFTSDNEKIGTVDQVLHPANDSTARDQHYFLVKPSMLDRLSGQDELYIPATTVQMVGEDRLVLETPTARIEAANWSQPRNVKSFRRS